MSHMLSQDDRRFLDKLGSPTPTSTCRLWSGARTANGWGLFWVGGRLEYAHYYQWRREHGEIPDGMRPVASCGDSLCVSHLELKPKRRLTDDAAAARRRRAGLRRKCQ